MSINNKPLNKTYNNNSYNPYRNSKLAKHSSTIDITEPVKLEQNFSPNYNNNEQTGNNNEPINPNNEPISPLNNELNLNYGINEINNQSNRNDTDNDQNNVDEKIITSSNSIENLNLNHEMAQMNDTYKFMKKQQRRMS